MVKNLAHKILEAHLVDGSLVPGEEIGIRIDHTLLQDATGTMAMLEFEALGLDRIRAELSAQYVDHNLLQTDNKNADDHIYLQTACARYGLHFPIRFTWSVLEFQEKLCWVQTVTLLELRVFPCWLWVQEGLT
jgi:homoaconitase/3-isopropylmalate dehydratase large subunit